jgi:hypothetical protein
VLWRGHYTEAKTFGKTEKRQKADENGREGHDPTVCVFVGVKDG